MSLSIIKIKDTEFKVYTITDPTTMKEGLSGKPSIGKHKGLLFDFIKEQEVTMNMHGMKYALDMIFINDSLDVIAVRTLPPGSFQTVVKGARYVLEVNEGEGSGMLGEKVNMNMSSTEIPKPNLNIIVKISTAPDNSEQLFRLGGAFKFIEKDVVADKKAMQVLDDKGVVLMNIVGGERIFSIEHTEQLIALAKKIDRGECSEDELGMLMEKIIHKQDTQAPEYVN